MVIASLIILWFWACPCRDLGAFKFVVQGHVRHTYGTEGLVYKASDRAWTHTLGFRPRASCRVKGLEL